MNAFKKYILNISIIATFAFLGLASYLPLTSIWGFDHLHFLPDIFKYLYVFVFLIILYLMFGPVPEKTIDTAIDKIDKWLWGDKILPRLIFVALCTAIFIIFRIESQFLGDSYSWPVVFGQGKIYTQRMTEIGSVYILRFIQNLLGGYTQETAQSAFRIMSIVSGGIYVYNIVSIIGKLLENKYIRISGLSTLLFSGSVLMFFGYVEFYPILWASISIFLNLSITYFKEHRLIFTAIGFYLISLLMHVQAICLLPGFVFLIVNKFESNKARKIGYSIMFFGAVGLSILIMWLYKTQIAVRILIMPVFKGFPPFPEYTMLSFSRMMELFNLAMLNFPGYLIIFCLWLFYRNKKRIDRITVYLSFLSFGSFLYLFLFRTSFSMGRDWDLMSLGLLAPTLLLIYRIDGISTIKIKRIIIIYVIITFFCDFSFLTANIRTIPSEKRFYTLLGDHDEGGWVNYADHFLSKGDTTHYREIYSEILGKFPGYKELKQADKYINNGNYDRALKLAQELLNKEPYNVNYIHLMGRIYRVMGQYDSSEVYYKTALALRYKPHLLNELGQLYLEQGKYDTAIDEFHKAHRLAPDTTSIIEALALAYIYKNEYDKALSWADSLTLKDIHSPGASLIRLTIAARQGDWSSARKYYLEFLKYGQGRSDYEKMRDYYKNLK